MAVRALHGLPMDQVRRRRGRMSETREEQIKRWEAEGRLDPGCWGCKEWFYSSDQPPSDVFAPRHNASGGCESGKRPHCTCDTCF